jgi:Domain of unknown function (DUF4902)
MTTIHETSFYAFSGQTGRLQSRDFLRRLRAKDMLALDWQHQDTWLETDVQDDMLRSCQLPIAVYSGITEWQASYQGQPISLGWDWFLGVDGQVHAYQAVPPRSNLQVLDAAGYDRDAGSHEYALWALIRTLPWQAQVAMTKM